MADPQSNTLADALNNPAVVKAAGLTPDDIDSLSDDELLQRVKKGQQALGTNAAPSQPTQAAGESENARLFNTPVTPKTPLAAAPDSPIPASKSSIGMSSEQLDTLASRLKSDQASKAQPAADTSLSETSPSTPSSPTPPGATAPAPPKSKTSKPPPPPPSTPDELQTALNTVDDAQKTGLGSAKADFQKKVSALDSLMQTYRDEYKANRDSTQWAEIAEKMGHALAQLGAGYQGLKQGVDMSTGLKFDKTDWSNRYKDLLSELREGLSEVGERQKSAQYSYGEDVSGIKDVAREGRTAAKDVADVKEKEAARRQQAYEAEQNRKASQTKAETNVQGRLDLGQLKLSSSGAKADTKQAADAQQGIQSYLQGLDQAANGATSDEKKKGQTLAEQGFARASKYFSKDDLDKVKAALPEGGLFSSPKPEDKQKANALVSSLMNTWKGQQADSVGAPPVQGMVKMKDPNTGEVRLVKPESVDKYKKAGAEVVQ